MQVLAYPRPLDVILVRSGGRRGLCGGGGPMPKRQAKCHRKYDMISMGLAAECMSRVHEQVAGCRSKGQKHAQRVTQFSVKRSHSCRYCSR